MGFRIGKTADGSVSVRPPAPEISSAVASIPPPAPPAAPEAVVAPVVEVEVEKSEAKNGLVELDEASVPAKAKAKAKKAD